MSRRWWVLGVGLGLYAIAMGFLSGMLLERVRFDADRASMLTRVTMAEQRLRSRLMDLERHRAPRDSDTMERLLPPADRSDARRARLSP